jgi:hypothetical protein
LSEHAFGPKYGPKRNAVRQDSVETTDSLSQIMRDCKGQAYFLRAKQGQREKIPGWPFFFALKSARKPPFSLAAGQAGGLFACSV